MGADRELPPSFRMTKVPEPGRDLAWKSALAVAGACHCGYSMTTPRLRHSRGSMVGEETGRRDDETVLGCGAWDVNGM